MRKIFISLMCCIMSLIFTFFLVSCGKEECEHDWGNGVVKTEATCISGGEIEYTCGKCQATKTENTETIDHKKSKDYKYDSLGHYLYCTVCEENFEKEEHTMVDLEVQQEPTAYDAGIMITKCSKCDYKSTRVIDAVPHQKGADYKFDDNYHWYECEAHEDCTVEIQKGKHTLVEGKVIKEAEAEKDGLREISCSVCDYKGEVVIPALNHRKGELDFDDNEHWYTCDRHPDCDAKIELEAHTWVLVSDSATCTEDGTAVYKCSVCPKTKEEASKATGHDYKDWVVIQEAQENEPGKKERECRVCGHKETASIPVIGHEHEYDTEWTIDKEPTCTEVGSKSHHCQGCDEKQDVTEIPATGHNYSNWKVTKPATLYTDGIETIFCSVCDEEGTDTRKIQAQADFRNDFNLETADGTWKYGSIDYQWGSSEDFTFTVLENKSNDAWLGDNIELKSDWFNAGSMLAIAYTVTEDVNIVIKVSFTGGLPGTTKLALRVGIKNSTGEIYGNPEYKGMNNNVIEETLKRELKAGDTIYFIFGNEDNSGYPNGHISLTLTKEVIHNYSEEWTIDIEPTCTEAGSKSHHCLDCDEKKDITEIPATGHNYGQLVDKVDKTCTTAGMEAHYKCSACNTYFNSDKEEVTEDSLVIPASHDLEPHSAKEPTCTEVGWNAYVSCKECDYTTKEEIEALGHNYSEEWTIDIEPTCTEAGSKSHHCQGCDEKKDVTEISATGHNYGQLVTIDKTCTTAGMEAHYKCSACNTYFNSDKEEVTEDTLVIPASHDLEPHSAKEPTCTEVGWNAYVSCKECDYTTKEEIEALGHNYSEEWTIDKEPTCIEAGSKSHHCLDCDEKKDITGIPATGHDYKDWVVIQEAQENEPGKKERECRVCGHKETASIPVIGHEHEYDTEWTIDKEPTCTEVGSKSHHCQGCDEKQDVTEISATGHNYGQLVTIDKTCTTAGMEAHYKCSACNTYFNSDKEEVTEDSLVIPASHDLEPHSAKEPTCTEVGWNAYVSCKECDYTTKEEIEALGHNYSEEWTIDKEPTCIEAGSKSHHCQGCDEKKDVTEISATGHNYGQLVDKVDKTCTTAGMEAHYKCSACNTYFNSDKEEVTEDSLVILASHDLEPHSAQEPTCTEVGWNAYETCMNCDYTTKEEIDALGHDYSVWKVTQDPTLYADGVETVYCSRCDEEGTNTRKIQAQADFRNDFNLETADGTWKYGSIDYHWADETFDFTAATEKNGNNDGWSASGVEIKNDWMNADGMVGIAYTVTENVHIVVNLKFVGGMEGTRLDLRYAVKNSEGMLYSNPTFYNDEQSNVLERLLQFDLNAGDTIYFIFSKGAKNAADAYPNGNLSINLRKPSADYRSDFNLETADGTWKYGSIDYHWDEKTFDFTPATQKNGNNDGWSASGIEIKNDWINAEDIVGIAYTVTENVHIIMNLKFVGGTETTRLDLRIGIKNSEGILYSEPSFHNDPNSNVLEKLVQFDLNAGDTIYFIFSNGASGVQGAWPNGNLDISIF